MRSRWTLAVEGLGRIDRAEIEVRPLTLFVGDNNSGKTYLASLLWDFYSRMPNVFLPASAGLETWGASFVPATGIWIAPTSDRADLETLTASPQYQACYKWLAEKLTRSEPYALSREDLVLLLSWFNERLENKKDAVVQRLFGREDMTMKGFEVHDLALDAPFSLVLRQHRNGASPDAVTLRATGYAPQQPRTLEAEFELNEQTSFMVLIALMSQFLSPHRPVGYLSPGYGADDPVFLPAPRTGFMQLYKAAARRSLRDAFQRGSGERQDLELTAPAFHFLDMIAFGLKNKAAKPYATEADYLERSLRGRVELLPGLGVNEYRYHPVDASGPLPMQLSSSLVTELAPLILVLRHTSAIPMLFFEEPEAHLHPHLIRLVARVITRLVRKGVQVCITTHSPDFCQQINNFIKLGSLPPGERARFQTQYGYEADDYLEESEVAGYQFQVGANGRSSVTRLPESPSGLAMPTFNEELIALSKEALELMQAVEGDE